MDVQHALLCQVVLDNDLLPLVEARIHRGFFTIEEHAQVFDLVMEHYAKHGKPPSKGAVHKAYPTYKFLKYPEPLRYYLNQLQQDRKKVLIANGVQAVAKRMLDENEGPSIGDELESMLRGALADAAHEVSQGRDSDVFESRERMMERLIDRRNNPGVLRGITTGFDGLDVLTGGWQNEQLITLAGTPKAGKSSLLLVMAVMAVSTGNSCLLQTFEMSTEEMEDRLMSYIAKVGLSHILSGTFDPIGEKNVDRALRLREGLPSLIISSDITSATTVSGIQGKVQQYQPRLLLVDGTYLMEDETGNDQGSPQAITQITRGLKRLAQANRIPVGQTTQAMLYRSKGGLHLGSIGYSSSFAQDSDTVVGVEHVDPNIDGVSRVKILGARSGPRGHVYVSIDWHTGTIEEITESEAQALVGAVQAASANDQRARSNLMGVRDPDDA